MDLFGRRLHHQKLLSYDIFQLAPLSVSRKMSSGKNLKKKMSGPYPIIPKNTRHFPLDPRGSVFSSAIIFDAGASARKTVVF